MMSLVLMVFIFVLVLALSAFTLVETQVATRTQAMQEARQTALLGLQTAIGQLQLYAGADQRVTAPADLEQGANTANGHWVGVYGNTVVADYSQSPQALQENLNKPELVDALTGSSARVLTWLVSGNEGIAFDPHFGGSDIGTDGQVLLGAEEAQTRLRVKPEDVVSGLDVNVKPNSEAIRIGGRPARLLVGPGTTTSAVADGVAVDYVAAPLMDVPAQGSTALAQGRYAWWVGEENTKARINLPAASGLADTRNAFLNAPRLAIELMARQTPYSSDSAEALTAERIGTVYDPAAASLPSVMELEQLAQASSEAAALSQIVGNRFHDLSAYSTSLLTDTYAGGLRQDLSNLLGATATSPSAATLLWPALTSSENNTFIPTWGHLRSFYNTRAQAGEITPQLPEYGNNMAGKVGISPVIAYVALGFRYASGLGPVDGSAIHFNIYPIIALWNPYNQAMAAEEYEVGMGFMHPDSVIELQVNNKANDSAPDNWESRERRDLRYAGKQTAKNDPTGLPMEYFRFKVKVPKMEPGETIVFTLTSPSGSYQAGSNEMSEGLNQSHYVTLSNNSILPGEGDKDYRVLGKGGLRANHHLAAYLGDGTAAPVSDNGSWDPLLNGWYQAVLDVDYPTPSPNPSSGGAGVHGKVVDEDGNTQAFIYADADLLRAASPMLDPQLVAFMMNVYSALGKGFMIYNKYGLNIPRYRWIAQGNVRSPYAFRSIRDRNQVLPYYTRLGSVTLNEWPTWYRISGSQDPARASSGDSMDYDWRTGEVVNAKLFQMLEDSQTLFSIAHLQHANLSLSNSYPSYPIGNAIADFRLPDGKEIYTQSGTLSSSIAARHRTYYDVSWLLNRALWDRYYFSALDGNVSLNPRYKVNYAGGTQSAVHADLADAGKAAARLLIEGGFNVNSTSEQAWRALLGGARGLEYNPEADGGKGGTSETPLGGTAFPRFSQPLAGTQVPSSVRLEAVNVGGENLSYVYNSGDNMQTLWEGYRVLSDNQISQLARNLVAEVRARGPFVSVADFVNRRVIDTTAFTTGGSSDDDVNNGRVKNNLTEAQKRTFTNALKGALQAAIDATDKPQTNAYPINVMDAGSYWNASRTVTALQTGTTRNYSLTLARGDLNYSTDEKTTARNNAAFAPKYLTQADVLSTIGSSLTARSDTFLIRAVGEAVDPTGGQTLARAWCEAVVQRVPEYVNPADAPDTLPANLLDINKALGRKFKLVSFRWLTQDEI